MSQPLAQLLACVVFGLSVQADFHPVHSPRTIFSALFISSLGVALIGCAQSYQLRTPHNDYLRMGVELSIISMGLFV